jgi:alcohol dehydrogenase class IV
MRTIWNFYSAGQLVFGSGAARRVGEFVAQRGWRKVFLVTDKRLEAAGVVAQVWRALAASGVQVELFDEGEAEPAVGVAVNAAAAARQFKPDAVLGLGGGSNMDLAKIVAVLLAHGGEPSRYFSYGNVPGPVAPLICMPTTAGTGSEVSHAAVLTDEANHIKVSTLSQFLRPALAVVDPLLTASCPPKVTADSGIDALTHAIEALTAIDFSQLPLPPEEPAAYEGSNPLGGCLAEKAISLIGEHLPAAVEDGTNLAAREGMALASTLAGLAFSNCAVALVHALEYPIGAVLHCSHGAGNGLLLPYVMRFNLPACPEKFAKIASLLGVNTAGLSPEAAGEAGIHAIEQLRARIGIPARIRELGGTADQLPTFAAKAFAIKRLRDVNPRPASQDDLLGILQAAW